MNEIEEKVIQIISDKLMIDPSEIDYASNLQSDLGAQDIDIIEIIVDVERAFELPTISDDLVAGIQTVDDIITMIQNLL